MSDSKIEPPFTPNQFATGLEYWKEAEKFQRKRAEAAEAENAELTRKLADSDTLRRQYFSQMCEVIEKNDKLLAESKSKVVPEGWKLVPIELTPEYVHHVHYEYYHQNIRANPNISAEDIYLILKAMLAHKE